jgi:hypothetical protein
MRRCDVLSTLLTRPHRPEAQDVTLFKAKRRVRIPLAERTRAFEAPLPADFAALLARLRR